MSAIETPAAVLALRREFDAGFAQEPRSVDLTLENLLAVRIGGDGYALRVADIGGLHVDKLVVPLPTSIAELKGVAGFRGKAAPVYDLAGLLGYPVQAKTRWLALARGTEPLALAFDSFDAHFSVAQHEIVRAPGSTLRVAPAMHPHVFDAARYGNAMLPIVDISALVALIKQRFPAASSQRNIQP